MGKVKRTLIVVISVLIAGTAAVGASIAAPESTLATGGGYVEECGGGEIFLSEKEERVLALHNQIRAEHDLPTLCVHPRLQEAARAHSKDMIQRDYFSHNTKGRGSFEKRLVRFDYGPAGYNYYRAGENIGLGSGPADEPENRMNAWMNSDGHRHNILNEEYREVGIGTHTGKVKDFAGVTMYTVDYGVRR